MKLGTRRGQQWESDDERAKQGTSHKPQATSYKLSQQATRPIKKSQSGIHIPMVIPMAIPIHIRIRILHPLPASPRPSLSAFTKPLTP